MANPLLSFGMAGDSGAVTRLEAFNATVRMVAWADKIGIAVLHELKSQAPVDKRGRQGSGRLRDSISYQRRTTIGNIKLTFHSDDPAAKYVINGTRGHPIGPSGSHITVQFPDAGGELIYRSVTSHPGAHANPFHQKAVDRMLPMISASFVELFERI